jgi:transposase
VSSTRFRRKFPATHLVAAPPPDRGRYTDHFLESAAERLNGIFRVLRSGAPCRYLPQEFGPYTTCCNRFVRWRRAGVWSRIMDEGATTRQPSTGSSITS